ncbi:GNAT family N-acetyltransferase [Desmospora profundinema]|uniref:GNAT superfamily N-acetyltransferase n=1 Tax=Desmospora profundinema TaxID=1571184 RepID=A0ABU1IME1_9BACL|nr:GNAT family N-acetyltransferase [Desmospora profundinema]MDR6225946.1 GNAT superfamily N-acetyltransferase [Desmospora profundinema]
MIRNIREAEQADVPFLWECLYHAIYVSTGEKPPSKTILEKKEIAHYLTGWGRKGDRGWVLVQERESVGGIWHRLFDANDPGYGFVSPDIPELTLSILPGYRGSGGGTRLLETMMKQAKTAGYAGLSLSVDRSNPARQLYEKKGFIKVKRRGTSDTMLLRFTCE